jgi:hypothetical protein
VSSFASLLGGLNSATVGAFGTEVTYIPSSGLPYAVSGVLESGEVAEARFPGAHHALWVPLASLAAEPTKEDQIEIDSRHFRVADLQGEPTDAGGVWLLLVFIRS